MIHPPAPNPDWHNVPSGWGRRGGLSGGQRCDTKKKKGRRIRFKICAKGNQPPRHRMSDRGDSKSKDAYHAFRGDLSLPQHLSPVQCDELVKFVQANFYWWAVKFENAPDPETGVMGKLHAHFIGVKSDWDSTRGDDPRFGAKRSTHLKDKLKKDAPSIGIVLQTNPNAKKYGCFLYKLTNDHYNSYFQKEGEMMYQNLPDDPATLYRYFATKTPKKHNEDIKAHVNRLTEEKWPVQKDSVAQYLNHRWFTLNDMAIVKNKAHRTNLLDAIWAAWSGMGFDFGMTYEWRDGNHDYRGTLKRPRSDDDK